MNRSLRQVSMVVAVGVALVACGGRSAPPLPAAPGTQAQGPSPVGTSAGSAVLVQESSVGVPPAGFKMVVRVDPRPGADGVIRGASPLTVRFDLCGSTADADKSLFFVKELNPNGAAAQRWQPIGYSWRMR